MLASISPLGERARDNRWSGTAGSYAAGCVLAAAAVGGALGAAGAGMGIPVRIRVATVAVAAMVAGIADLAVPRRIPTLRRQVDERWIGVYRGWVYGLGFGLQLGAGVVTVVTTATVYAWVVAAFVSGSATAGAMAGIAFGIGRSIPLLTVRRATTPESLRVVLRRYAAAAAPARYVAAVSSMALGAGVLAVTAGGLG